MPHTKASKQSENRADLMIFKKRLRKCVDWSKINKKDYLNAMVKSCSDSTSIRNLLENALTDEIHSREMYMKGIDYSYYYEETDDIVIIE